MDLLKLGSMTVQAVDESVVPSIPPEMMFPRASPDALEAYRSWLEPHFMGSTGGFNMATRTHVVRTERSVILVDTCFGNHKDRSACDPTGHMLDTPYLSLLASVGVEPDGVDFVVCTHLHPDHVGWNTRLQDGRWVPTFPNAKYLFPEVDWDHFSTTEQGGYGHDSFQDSVLPIAEAGLAVLHGGEHEIEQGVVATPSPGHTPGHSSLRLASGGEQALIVGDLFHHPVQCAEPSWELEIAGHVYTMDPTVAEHSRRTCLAELSETNGYLLAAHWANSQAVRVEAVGNSWRVRM